MFKIFRRKGISSCRGRWMPVVASPYKNYKVHSLQWLGHTSAR